MKCTCNSQDSGVGNCPAHGAGPYCPKCCGIGCICPKPEAPTEGCDEHRRFIPHCEDCIAPKPAKDAGAREWIIPAEWQVDGKKYEASDVVTVVLKSDYEQACKERDDLSLRLANTIEMRDERTKERDALQERIFELEASLKKCTQSYFDAENKAMTKINNNRGEKK